MSHPSKTKGTGFERELVNQAAAAGLTSVRAYASNGKALGESEQVDLIAGGARIQAKRRKRVAGWMKPADGVDAVAFREDRGESHVVLRWSDFLRLLSKRARDFKGHDD